MKLIADIRLYKSELPSTDSNINPKAFASKELNAVITRIVMKLRENNFSLADDYDHLYINYTFGLGKNEIKFGKRLDIKEFSWFQYCDVGISRKEYEMLENDIYNSLVLDMVKKVLIEFFSKNKITDNIVEDSFKIALTEGENMLMKFKEKKTSKKYAIVYLRCLNNGHFFPLLRVYDEKEEIVLEEDLPETIDANYLGEILLNNKRIEIRPKKNVFSSNLKPIIYEFQ